MKIATVRDLRQRFGDVAKWIEAGEEVAVTRRGEVVATLSPPKPAEPPRRADWAKRFRERPPITLKKPMSAEQTAGFYEALKRDL